MPGVVIEDNTIITTVLWEGFGVPLSSLFGYDSVLVVIQSILDCLSNVNNMEII